MANNQKQVQGASGLARAIVEAAEAGTVLRVRYRNQNGERSYRDLLPVSGLCWNAEKKDANFNAFSHVLEHSRRNYTPSGFFPFVLSGITFMEGPTGVVVPADSIAKLARVPQDHVLVFPGPETKLEKGTFAKPAAIHADELDFYMNNLGFQLTPWVGDVVRDEPRPWTPQGAEYRNSLDRRPAPRNPFELL